MTLTAGAGSAGAVHERGARVPRIPPPLYYGAAFAAGMLLRGTVTKVSLDVGARPVSTILGGVVLGSGVVMCLAAVNAVLRHRTTIVPHRPVAALLTAGPYRISRNPMYAGLAIAYLGGTLLAGTWWPLVTLPLAILPIRTLVIGPEERYLAGRFGPAYLDYRARVRRWI